MIILNFKARGNYMKRVFNASLGIALFLFSPISSKELANNSHEASPKLHGDRQKHEMLGNLEVLRHVFNAGYALKAWKKSFFKWNLHEEIKKVKDKVRDNKLSVKEYQRAVRGFFYAARDYHVTVSFANTESASLPFVIKGAEGRYFISKVTKPQTNFGLSLFIEVGDEVLTFNGESIVKVMQDLKKQEGMESVFLTDQSLTETTLTARKSARGHLIPKGAVTVGIKKKTGQVINVPLQWSYTPQKVNDPVFINPTKKVDFLSAISLPQSKQKKWDLIKRKMERDSQMVAPYFIDEDWEADENQESFKVLGVKESFLPPLGRILWSTPFNSPFEARLYYTSDRNFVGFVRIPHYMPEGAEEKEFAAIINYLNKASNVLVIDQLNNPGGSIFYLYTLASMLTEKVLDIPKHRIKITQKDALEAIESIAALETIKTNTDARKHLGEFFMGALTDLNTVKTHLNYYRFIRDQWNEGKKLTDPIGLLGVDKVAPHSAIRYRHPILLLINELDFSGGDFFASILQDNKRAVLMGARTAGAGGFVLTHEFPNHFGIKSFRYTGSQTLRESGQSIENLGIDPDIPYTMTVEDLQRNYAPFVGEILKVIKTL